MDRPAAAQSRNAISVFSPVVTKERFARLSGLTEGVIQGLIEKGHLPSVKIGRHRLINLVVLASDCGQEA